MNPLIPHPTTDLDRRVNRAYELAVERQKVMWVWVEQDYILIGPGRPERGVAIAVHPDGFAMTLTPTAVPPWPED